MSKKNPDYLIGEIELTTYWELRIVNVFIVATILIILCALHTHRVLADYKLKKVLGDDIGKNFAKIASCTVGSIFFYTVSMFVGIFRSWTVTVTEHENDCAILYALGYWTYMIGKLLMFFVFLLRVKISYEGSVYAYNNKLIWGLVIFTFVTLVSLMIISEATAIHLSFSLAYFGLPNAALCIRKYGNTFTSLTILWTEISMSVICVLLFVVPLYKLLKLNATGSKDSVNTRDASIAQAAYKTSILTATAALSTAVMYIIVRYIDTYFGALWYPEDSVINVLSLMLMTKYYDKSKCLSFNTLCCCCNYNVLLKCCKINITGKSAVELATCTSSSSVLTSRYKSNSQSGSRSGAAYYCEGCLVRVTVEGRVTTKGASTETIGEIYGTTCARNANGSGGHKMVQVVINTIKVPKSLKTTDLTHTASVDAMSVTSMTSANSVNSSGTPIATITTADNNV